MNESSVQRSRAEDRKEVVAIDELLAMREADIRCRRMFHRHVFSWATILPGGAFVELELCGTRDPLPLNSETEREYVSARLGYAQRAANLALRAWSERKRRRSYVMRKRAGLTRRPAASAESLERARRMLERNGYIVTAPSVQD